MSRKRWNNIIIITAIFMIGTLSFLDQKTTDAPAQTQALFDRNTPLEQLQLNGIWLAIQSHGHQCDANVLNCDTWVEAWQEIEVSPINKPIAEALIEPQELVIKIQQVAKTQVWLLFAREGILKSPSGNWYQIPPSLKANLQPILDSANPQ